ncbi:unnamed protein product [Rhizophagus irregularis]|nr:unnamed protein product [Rhizophagus irregularis]
MKESFKKPFNLTALKEWEEAGEPFEEDEILGLSSNKVKTEKESPPPTPRINCDEYSEKNGISIPANAPKQNARQFEDVKSLKLLCWELELDPQIEPGDLVKQVYAFRKTELLSTHNTSEDVTQPVNIDGAVSPAMLHALEQSDELIDMRYLLRAQGTLYFMLDVCYIWHSHLLSPLRYYEDMRRIYDPQQNFPDFPLIRLHDIWEKNGSHTDPVSESIWVERTNNHGYRSNYVNLIKNDNTDEKCLECNAPYSIETLSAKRFIDDISAWNKDGTHFIGGTLVDLNDGSFSEALATNNSCLLLFTTTSFHIRNLTDSESKNWNHAVQRQRDFTEKMVNNEWINCMEVQ